jgi:capsule polysaccharide export protein KpsE/RkpR
MLPLLMVLVRHKKAIALAAVAGFVVSAAVSLILPPRYLSSAAFIPGGVEREITARGTFLEQLSMFGDAYATFVRVRRNFVIDYIIRSRQVAGKMDEAFDLRSMYRVETLDDVRRELNERTHIDVRDDGVIEIAVEARDPVLARDMTAALIGSIDSILVGLSTDYADEKRRFLDEEVVRRERRVAEADSAMTEFMARYGIFEVEAQAKAAFAIIGALTAKVSELEIERRMLEMTAREGTPELQRMDLELEKLQEEISRLTESGGGTDLFPSLADMPRVSTEYFALLAERMAQEFALAFVRLKLEDAAISSRQTDSAIRVIDPPFVPERRVWPKRKQIVMVLTLASVLWTCLVLIVRDRRTWEAAAGSAPAAGGRDLP